MLYLLDTCHQATIIDETAWISKLVIPLIVQEALSVPYFQQYLIMLESLSEYCKKVCYHANNFRCLYNIC